MPASTRDTIRRIATATLTLVVAGSLPLTLTPPPPAAAATQQRLVWTACAGIANPALRCATVQVPLDQGRPHGRTVRIAISRLAATDPERRRGVLLTTGGGPGGPGVPLPDELSRTLDPAILAQYDLVGFDLRFLERSSPISCGYDTEEPGGWWSRFDGYQRLPLVAAQAAQYAKACATTAGWALPHATTANVARDLEVIRQVLDEPKLSYLGGSYAAMLGSVYASMYPDRVDRFVLDSPPDYTTVWRQFDLDRTAGMESNLAAYLEWLANHEPGQQLGTSASEVRGRILDLFDRASRAPVIAGDHEWTFDEIGAILVSAIFFEEYWSYYAPVLAALVAGTAPPYAVTVRPTPAPGATGVPADNHTALGTAFRCADGWWPRDVGVYRRDLDVYKVKYPVFGATNPNLAPCAFWPTPTGADRVRLGTHRAPGALVLAATGDASVPLANSVAVAQALEGSRLVTVNRRTHVPFLGGSPNACLITTVTDYLVAGRLPGTDTTC